MLGFHLNSLHTTIIAAVVGTLWMALAANYPIAIAPGMGLNAYFAYSVVGTHDISYQTAFAAVFCSRIIFGNFIINAFPEGFD